MVFGPTASELAIWRCAPQHLQLAIWCSGPGMPHTASELAIWCSGLNSIGLATWLGKARLTSGGAGGGARGRGQDEGGEEGRKGGVAPLLESSDAGEKNIFHTLHTPFRHYTLYTLHTSQPTFSTPNTPHSTFALRAQHATLGPSPSFSSALHTLPLHGLYSNTPRIQALHFTPHALHAAAPKQKPRVPQARPRDAKYKLSNHYQNLIFTMHYTFCRICTSRLLPTESLPRKKNAQQHTSKARNCRSCQAKPKKQHILIGWEQDSHVGC